MAGTLIELVRPGHVVAPVDGTVRPKLGAKLILAEVREAIAAEVASVPQTTRSEDSVTVWAARIIPLDCGQALPYRDRTQFELR